VKPIFLIAVFIGVAAYVGAAGADNTEYIELEGVINIMSTTSPTTTPVVTTQEALDAVEEANKILKQAGIRVHVKKVNSNPSSAPVSAGNADGNASLTTQEDTEVRNAGSRELETVVGKQKGIKFTFVNVPDEGDLKTIGTGVHHRRTVIIKNGSTSQETGITVAHEMGHALTLSTQMVVATQPTTLMSDPDGHVNDPDNLMNDTLTESTTQLTTSQSAEIRKKAKTWGRTVTKFSDAAPTFTMAHGNGGVQDVRGDVPPGLGRADLDTVHAYHCCDEALIELALATTTPFDSGPPSATRFYWLFDVDSNPGTGVPVAGVPGIESGVELTVFWPGNGQPTTQVEYRNYLMGTGHPLPPASIVNEYRVDVHPPDLPEPRVVVMANYAELGFVAPVVPLTVVAQDVSGGGQFVDRADGEFQIQYEESQPQLTINPTLGQVGQPISFNGSGFAPNHPMRVLLDAQLVLDGIFTQLDGSISGSFIVPNLPAAAPRNVAFVTLVEVNGRSAFSVLNFALTPCIAGDVNRDGVLNGADASPLVATLLSPQSDPAIICAADVNGDGTLNGLDIQEFVSRLP